MCDFEDDFNQGEFMDEDTEMDGLYADESEFDNNFDETESQENDFTTKDAFIIGGAFGFGYEEGLRERKRKKRKRYSDNSV